MPSAIQTLSALQAVALVLAAGSDVAKRRIPDFACLTVGACGVMSRLLVGPRAALVSFGVALLVFVALAALHALRVLGGGDVKLLAACALGLAPADLPHLLVLVALAGGILGALHMALRRLPPPAPAAAGAGALTRIIVAERWRIARRGSMPYGIAIAAGAIWLSLLR